MTLCLYRLLSYLHDEQGRKSPLYYDQMFKIFDPVEVTQHLGTTEYSLEALEPQAHFDKTTTVEAKERMLLKLYLILR